MTATQQESFLADAYERCRRVHRRRDPTYYFAARQLPPEVRPAVHAVYALVRRADDIVDDPRLRGDARARRRALDALGRRLSEARRTGVSSDPELAALLDAAQRYDLPLEALDAYLDAMRCDCGPVRMETRSELESYVDGIAVPVGLLLAPLLGGDAEGYARLGRAFQLTNVIRDVREDWALDRVYLPREEREAYGVAESVLAGRDATPGFRALMAVEVGRARELFAATASLVGEAPPRMRPGMRLARGVYVRVLDRVEALGFDVLGHRTSLPPWQLGGAVFGALRPGAAA